ncbi:MAG: cofactor-independent phosphoglycerate mutase [Eubacteriales bacterium]|jgi:2,3-bisphosphoglycerate-independent phosphoglycerate mutase
MKYVVILGDGMADRPLDELDGKTPLEAANIPAMDFLARNGDVGLVKTIPDGMSPGSDTANLSVLGYDPSVYYTGRSPLEAVSMGVSLGPTDVAMRCNLVTLSDGSDISDTVMVDYSAGEISTDEARLLIKTLRESFQTEKVDLFPGVSYRHCLVLRNAKTGSKCIPPHDISGCPVKVHLPTGRYGTLLLEMMERSRQILRHHPVNISRMEKGLNPANACWFWGEGTSPSLPLFRDKFGVDGSVISAVDLVKGIGICAGMSAPEIPGATGNINTNFRGKADFALEQLNNGADFVFVHIEAPDECGHQGNAREKTRAIELIDSEVLERVLDGLNKSGHDYSILLLPDHPTPVSLRTHTSDAVPFVLYRSKTKGTKPAERYTENLAGKTGLYIPKGHKLMEQLILNKF